MKILMDVLCSTRSSVCVYKAQVTAVTYFSYSWTLLTCLVAVKEEKVSEKEALSVTEKSFVITSKVSLSQPSVVLLAEAVSSESLAWSTRRPVVFLKFSLRTWSVMLWHTPSTPRERLWQPWMWCTLWRDKAALCTDSVVRQTLLKQNKRLL